ncbi:MAG: STAS domain-containing protein [Hyphomicrobiales bacterium]|nr:STAS domain-containing protein [Hyphomicrobiales bacterium]
MGKTGDRASGDEATLKAISDHVAGSEGLRIDLAAVMDATMAAELRDVLTEAIASDKPVRVSAGPVEQISTGCVQMLLAGAKSAAAINNTFFVSDQSDAFIAALDDLGLCETREDWIKLK